MALGGPWRFGIADPGFDGLGRRQITGTAMATRAPDGRRAGPPVTMEADTATQAKGLSAALCFMDAPAVAALRAAEPALRSVTLISPSGDLSTI